MAGWREQCGRMARWVAAALGVACAQGWYPLVSAATAAYAVFGDVGFVLGPLWPGYALGALATLAAARAEKPAEEHAEKPAGARARRTAIGRLGRSAGRALGRLQVSAAAALVMGLVGAMLLIVSHSMADLFGGMPVAPVAVLAFAGCLLMGAGSSALCAAWWRRLDATCAEEAPAGRAEETRVEGAPCIACVSVSAAVAVFVLVGLFSLMGHTVWSPLFNAALMLGSFGGLRLWARGERADERPGEHAGERPGECAGERAGRMRGLPGRACAGCLILGAAASVMLGQFVGAQFARALTGTWVFGLVGVAVIAAVLIAVHRVTGRWDAAAAGWAVAALLVVAFYPIDAGSDFSLKFAMAGTACALGAALAALPAMTANIARVGRLDTASCWVEATLCLGLGAAVGAPLGYWVAGTLAQGSFVLVSAIAAMVAGFVTLVLLIRPSTSQATGGDGVSAGAGDSGVAGDGGDGGDVRIDARCAALAAAHGLTPREAQVLLVLARGYDVARVQDELGVSEGTALTHKRHIYQKLGVHTRSDLLDLVRDGA